MTIPRPCEPGPWRKLGSTRVIQNRWLKVRRDRVRLPSGKVIPDYYVWEHPAWVNVIGLTEDGRLILVRQYRHGLGRVDYELPGGVCDGGEDRPIRAARRELREETGFGGGRWRRWMVLSANPARQDNLSYTFLATGVRRIGEPIQDATEEMAVHLVTRADARRIVQDGTMIHALHVAPLLKLFLERQW